MEFRPVIVMPTFNNAGTLPDIVARAGALGLPRIVVNDGSTDGTAGWLERWTAQHPEPDPPLTVVTHDANCGKAAALHSGFEAAAAAGHTHAVTLDTDGQLDPEDIPALLEIAAARPRCLVIGERDDRRPDYPARSRLGRRLTSLAIALECGATVRDNQCGLRVYPLELVRAVRCRSGRFAWEAEIITRAAWAGFDIATAPVNCRYFPAGERVSHFKPWRDSLHGIALHGRLLSRAMLPIPHRRVRATAARAPWRRLLAWLSPVTLWRQVRDDEIGPGRAATGVGVGVFIANTPLYGLHTLLALYAARRWHLHPLAVVAGSNLSIPPVAAVLIAAAVALGHLILHGHLPDLAGIGATPRALLDAGGALLLSWLIGGVILGVILGVMTGALTWLALRRLATRAR